MDQSVKTSGICRGLSVLSLVLLLGIITALFGGCHSEPSQEKNDSFPVETTPGPAQTQEVVSYIPEGYGLKVQRIADNQMILRLRDPNLRESYPGFLPGKEDQQYAMWAINIGEHWSLYTNVYGSEHDAGYNENATFNLSDRRFVQTSLTYDFDSYGERSDKRRASVGMPEPELYTDGQELIYVLNIPDDVAMGFVEDYTYHVYIENTLDGKTESFSITEAEARTSENLLPEDAAAKKDASLVTFMPISSDLAFLRIDEAGIRRSVRQLDAGQSAPYRLDFVLGDLSIVINGEYQSDGSLAVIRIVHGDTGFSHTWLPDSFTIGQGLFIPINQDVMEQQAEIAGGHYVKLDFLAMDDALVQCDLSISPPGDDPLRRCSMTAEALRRMPGYAIRALRA